ncbi:MAG: NAD(P)-dependent alcohol dehydrogenase [Chitinophagales bacterium]
MKAIVCTQYGSTDVLQVQEVDKPTPKENEILIKISASSITTADTMMRRGTPLYGRLFIGLTKPKHPITGTGFAGVIESVGKAVTLFKEGDEVFGETTLGFGTNAEYVCIAEDGLLTKKPSNITFEEAATVCDGALTSLNFLQNIAKIQRGQSILINGASGSLGTSAVQLAKQFGVIVTGVCSSSNVEMVKALGADEVIDHTKTDFTKNGKTYDVVFDTIGKSSFSYCKKSLSENGLYISPVLSISLLFQMLWTSKMSRKKALFSATGLLPIPELSIMLRKLKELLEANKLSMLIDKKYNLEQVAEAHKYIDTGRKKGNVVAIC